MKGNFTLFVFVLLIHHATGQKTCPANIDFEAGSFNNWQCYTGSTSVENGKNAITVTSSTPVTNRHTLYAKGAATVLDPYGLFPVNPRDGSGYAVMLVNDIKGAEAER